MLVIGYWVFSNIFSLSVAVAIFERQMFFSAISRSWQLIKGNFWGIFGVRTIWALAVLAISYAAQGVLSLFNIFMGGIIGFGGSTLIGLYAALSVLVGLISFVISFAVMPLEGILHASIYFNQRIKKEGLDIDDAIEGLKP